MKPRLGDVFIMLSIIILAALSAIPAAGAAGARTTAVICHDGAEAVRIRLDGFESAGEHVVFNDYGCVVTAGDGGIRVSESNCKDQVCVRAGRISTPGRSIICLPNKLAISVEGSDAPDAVV